MELQRTFRIRTLEGIQLYPDFNEIFQVLDKYSQYLYLTVTWDDFEMFFLNFFLKELRKGQIWLESVQKTC